MKVEGTWRRAVELAGDGWTVRVLDQAELPYRVQWLTLSTLADAARAIRDMHVRGAPLIGAVAAYGVALALHESPSGDTLEHAHATLAATRPTAINLRWALAQTSELARVPEERRVAAAYAAAARICDEEVARSEAIGTHGLALIREVAARVRRPVRILTHCNAGWLATVDWGTALAPIYKAHEAGIPVHVWADETRPRNQGLLTAWELAQHGVPHSVVVDNAGGHLMQQGLVDLCIVGTDRTTREGDVCNKIGTYLKALAAYDNRVPFYAAVPSPSIDWQIDDGAMIPIEARSADEVRVVRGLDAAGAAAQIAILSPSSDAANPGFDVTPARLVTGLITERGVCAASRESLASSFPEHTSA